MRTNYYAKIKAGIARESARLQADIDKARPEIELLARTGTAEQRRVARAWLRLDEKARRKEA